MKGLAIEKSQAEEIRKILLEGKKLARDLKPLLDDDRVIFPLLEPVSGVGEEVERNFEERGFQRGVKIKVPIDFIGDIAVVRDIPSKKEIEFLLSKPNVKTVLLNQGVDGDYRVMNLKWLGGDAKYDTFHKENNLIFYIDLRKAYFNPRLSTERARVAALVRDGETIIDMFSGIGPFALNIASKKDVLIYGIDKNPWAIKLMKRNIELNKLRGEIIPVNKDARDIKLKGDRLIMNLPFHSLDFLDVATSLLEDSSIGYIHLYSIFKRGEEERKIREIEEKVGKFKCELVKEKGYSTSRAIGFFDLEKTS